MSECSIEEVWKALKEPFPVEAIHWRVGATNKQKTSCIPLAYIDARDVMKRLDDVVSPYRWQCNYTNVNHGIICNLGILHPERWGNEMAAEPQDWIWKADGAGATQVEGEKGAFSDALKRAGVRWGIGRYLYYLPTVWVPLKDGRYIESPPKLPSWAYPRG